MMGPGTPVVCLDYAALLAMIWYPVVDESSPGWRPAGWNRGLRAFGDLMAFDAAIADGLLLRRRIGRSKTAALVLAAIALALGAAAWISDPDQTSALVSAALPRGPDRISFDDRFASLSEADVELKFRLARGALARQLVSQKWRTGWLDPARLDGGKTGESSLRAGSLGDSSLGDGGLGDSRTDVSNADESKPASVAGVPLPRSRPAMADLESQAGPALALADNGARSDDRTLLQKLSDLLPGRIKLASLTPEGGLFRKGPDLTSLGYDNLTAVYDISAHAVYLPNGLSLEAHSGMGSLKDDPEHVSVPNLGATPPAVYELKPRERLFHGVPALRMTPAEGSTANGRSGLLAHSYMLGPDGDSNGCVSIRNYDRFLKAFNDGEINRLVVVPSLGGATMAAQRSNTPS